MKQFYSRVKGIFLTFFLGASFAGFSQNVGINGTGAAPDGSAGLDVSFTDKGVLIPQVSLNGSLDNTTIPSPAISLLVYNKATAGSPPNNVTPGYYYWTGTSWTRFATGNVTVSGWGTSGNSGTTPVNNFIGTTDSQDLVFKTAATEKMRITASGNVGIGSADFDTDDPEKLLVSSTGTKNAFAAYGNVNSYLQAIVQNSNSGIGASSDFVVANDFNNPTIAPDGYYLDFGINSTGYQESKSNILNQKSTPYMYSSAPQWFYIGNGYPGKGLVFFTNGGSLNKTASADGWQTMTITAGPSAKAPGNVGIGDFATTATDFSVTERLMVDGNITPKTTAVGTLGTASLHWNNIYANGATISGAVVPAADDNNSYTLGSSSLRWKTIYAVNSTISTSDRRLKTNIKPMKYGLREVQALEPVTFNWKSEPNGEAKLGLIAQDLKKVLPETVVGDETKENLGVAYSDLIPVLINAIKEQQKQIEELKQKVTALEKK